MSINNTSETREERIYWLSFVQGSNPIGSIDIIGGSLTPVPCTVTYLGDVVITVSVKNNQCMYLVTRDKKFLATNAWSNSFASTATLSAYLPAGAGAGGTSAWENASNWSCGSIPDANTDVIINSGSVILNSSTSCRSLTLSNTGNFTIHTGFLLTLF